jgi:hypothetical protein
MAKRDWKITEATVFTCGVQNEYQPGAAGGSVSSDYLITFSYEIDGEWYSGEFPSSTPREEGSKFNLKYDAAKPGHNEYSIDSAMNSLWFKIFLYGSVILVTVLYFWYRDFYHR